MEFTKLQYFVCVAGSDSMQKAAEILNVSQSTLSMAIKSLEQELGVALFQRVGRKLELTEAGSTLQIEASNILIQLENIKQKMKLYQGGSPTQISIATEAPDFSAEAELLYRKITPSFKYNQDLSPRHAIRPLLQSNKVDFAITLFDDSDSTVESTLLLREPMMLLVREDHPLCTQETINLNQLSRESLISLPESYAFRSICEQFFSITGYRPTSVHEVYDPDMTPRAVYSGYGVGFIPRSTYLQSRHLISYVHALTINDAFCARQIYLTRLRDRQLSQAAETFLHFLVQFGRWTALHKQYPTPDHLDALQTL